MFEMESHSGILSIAEQVSLSKPVPGRYKAEDFREIGRSSRQGFIATAGICRGCLK